MSFIRLSNRTGLDLLMCPTAIASMSKPAAIQRAGLSSSFTAVLAQAAHRTSDVSSIQAGVASSSMTNAVPAAPLASIEDNETTNLVADIDLHVSVPGWRMTAKRLGPWATPNP